MEDRFEREWKKMMEGASVSPPQHVWENIDHKLANDEVVKLRKKAFYYKWAAIVAMLIAVTVSIANYLPQESISTISASQNDSFVLEQSQQIQSVPTVIKPEENRIDIYETNKGSKLIVSSSSKKKVEDQPKIILADSKTDEDDYNTVNPESSQMVSYNEETLPVLNTLNADIKTSDPLIAVNEAAIKPIYIFKRQAKRKVKKDYSKYWAGVAVGSGSYDPNYSMDSNNPVTTALLENRSSNFVNAEGGRVPTPNIEENIEAGLNYNVNLNMGMRLTERLTLESGVQYSIAQTQTNTNLVIENRFFSDKVALTSEAASLNAVTNIVDQQEIIEYNENDISLNNTFRFTSVPLRAGYIVLDKKFNLRVNAGMLTNFYLGNSLEESSGNVASMDIKPGSNSPYRQVSFAGMAGVTMGYRLNNWMNLSIEPNYSHYITPLTKESSNFEFAPSGVGIMAGLQFDIR